MHALRREFIHCASVTQPQFVSCGDTLDGLRYQPQEPFVLRNLGNVCLWVLEREDLFGHEVGEVVRMDNRLILNRL